VSYNWTFGDGTTGSGSGVSHTYASRGTYTVGLTVRDGAGLTATAYKTVNAKPGK
jgi:PKD repeat protein